MITFADEEIPQRNQNWFEPGIRMLHTDCLAYMATLPDKAFDLAVVDPPYGSAGGGAGLGIQESVAFRGSL